MKSVVQEASSVAKAVDAGWRKANKPAEFRVCVMEEGKSGFLGFNSEPAKIVVYFDDKPKAKEQPRRAQKRRTQAAPVRPAKTTQRPSLRTTSQPSQAAPSKKVEPKVAETPVVRQQRELKPREATKQNDVNEVLWTPDMVEVVREWISQALQAMSGNATKFSIQPSRYYLKVVMEQQYLVAQDKPN